jgi:hypothetical protein
MAKNSQKKFKRPSSEKIEIPENLKGHFCKITFYGLHAGNNLNLI